MTPPDDQWWAAAPLVQQPTAPAKPLSSGDQWWAAAPLAQQPDSTADAPRRSRTGGLPPAKEDTDDNISDLARADDAQRNAPGFEDMAPDADTKGPSNAYKTVQPTISREQAIRQNADDAAASPVASRLKVALGQQGQSPQQVSVGMNQGRADMNAALGTVTTHAGQALQGTGNIANRAELSISRAEAAQAQRSLNILDQIDQGKALTNFQDPAGFRFSTPEDRAQLRQQLTARLNPVAQPPNPAMTAGQVIETAGEKDFPVPKENEGFGIGVARTVAGVAVPVAAGLVGGPAAAAAVFYPQSFQAHYEEAKAKGASDDLATEAAHAGAATDTAVMAVPLHQALSYVPAPLKDGFAKAAADLVKAGVTFSGASALDTAAQNYVAQQTFDPQRPILQGVATAAAEGAVAGPIVHAGVGAAGAAAAHIADLSRPSASPEFLVRAQQVQDAAAQRQSAPPEPAQVDIPAPSPGYTANLETLNRIAGAPPANQAQAAPSGPAERPSASQAGAGAPLVGAEPPTPAAQSTPIPEHAPAPPDQAPSPYATFRPDELTLSPKEYQYKESDPATGENGALSGVKRWDPNLAEPIDAYERLDGKTYVVNGHQRTNLALRAQDAGQTGIQIPAKVYREADGWTPEAMRLLGAYKNIAQGSGSAIDAAKIMRSSGVPGFTPPDLPPRSAMVQQAQGLSRLSDEAFGAAVNGVVPHAYAAEVGRMISDPAQQMAAIRILHQAEPANVEQARIMVQDVRNSGFLSGTQDDMFGSQAFAQSLFPERAKVLAQALQNLRGNKKVFQAAVSGEDALTAAGNQMDTAANQKGQTENERLIDTLQRTATTHGPISDALTAAAKDVAAGKQTRSAAADFLARARAIDRDGQSEDLQSGAGPGRAGAAGEGEPAGEAADVGPPQEGLGLFSSRGSDADSAPSNESEAHGAEDLHAAMRDLMRMSGLPPAVGLRLQERIGAAGADGRGTADGHYLKGLITFALDTKPSDIPAKLFHEIVHAIRDPALGLLKPGEREALDQAARKWLRQGTNRADIERVYGTDAPTVHEEAIARLAERALTKARSQPSYITRLADRMVNFVRGLGQALRGRGFTTADDVFRSMMRGERTGEQVGPPIAADRANAQFAKRPARIDDKAALEREGQGSMFGRSAVQAQAARDAELNAGRVPQKPADEGLFAPRGRERQAELYGRDADDQLTASVRPDEGIDRIVADARSIAAQRSADQGRDRNSAVDDRAPPAQPDAGRQVSRPPADAGGQRRLFSLRDDGRDPAVRERDRTNLALNLTQPRGLASLEPVRAIARNALAILSPTSLRGAKATERVVRGEAARQARSYARTVADLSDLRDAVNRLPTDEQYLITDRAEAGQRQATPELQAVADMIRGSYDAWAKKIHGLGKGYLEDTIENYMGHIYSNYDTWKKGLPPDPDIDPMDQARAGMASKSPIRGSGNFLKRRSFATQREAMDAGLIPISSNPVDIAMIKLREMQKMYHGTRMADEMKQTGIAHWVPVGQEGEARAAGWVALDDKVFRPTTMGAGAQITHGTWWAPEEAARIFNNYTSRGWTGQPIYDAIRASGNALNQMQLGLSGFHATFVTLDSAISKAALGVKQVARGIGRGEAATVAKGVGNIAMGATPGVGTLASAALTTARGAALRKAILYPEGATPEMRKIADYAMTAGARVAQQQILRAEASGSFVRNLADFTNGHVFREIASTIRNTPLTSPFRLAGRLVETMAQPLMEAYVPRAKLGVFYYMAKDWAEANPNATPEATADAMIKAWDSVDNRMGQLVYDNLFWNKQLKDLAFITTRSVGWNLGTIRELGGAAVDTIEQVARIAQRKSADVTHRMAYAMAMPLVTGVLGGTMTYLLTGSRPQDKLDYFYPRRSDGSRLSIPGYIKDVIDYTHDPFQTLANKAHPLISVAQQVESNRDYYGGIIYDPQHDNIAQAYAEYLLNQTLPFAVRSIAKEDTDGATGWEKAAAFFGFQPAPAAIANPEKNARWQMQDNMKAYRKRLREPGRMGLSAP